MDHRNNYDQMLQSAKQRFLEYDPALLRKRPGVQDGEGCLTTRFFSQQVKIDLKTGEITLDGVPADFSQTLSVLDWLCDQKENAAAAMEFCSVESLPGVFVGGSGLSMEMPRLARAIDAAPEAFCDVCKEMGGAVEALGDIGFRLEIFPELSLCLKFYHSDEEFAPQLTLLWDRNILQFVRYETVYYIAGCLQRRLMEKI